MKVRDAEGEGWLNRKTTPRVTSSASASKRINKEASFFLFALSTTEVQQNMEQSLADLFSDVFSDVSLPSYQAGELDFEPLQEEDGSGKSNGGRLPALTEVDEDDDPEEEETVCVFVDMLEEDAHCSMSGFSQDELWGDIFELGGQEAEDGQELSAEDEALMDDMDAGGLSSLAQRSQMIGFRTGCWEGDQMKSGGITGSGKQAQDMGMEQEFSTQHANSQEDHGVECPQANAPHAGSDTGAEGGEEDYRGLKDGRNLSERFVKEEGGKESQSYTDTDSNSEVDTDTDSDAGIDRDVDLDAGIDRDVDSDAGIDRDVDSDAGIDRDVDSDAGIDRDVDSDTDIVPDVGPVSDDVTDSDADIVPDVGPVSDDVTDSDADIVPDVGPVSDDVTDSDADIDIVTDILTDAPVADDVTDPDTDIDIVTDIVTDDVTDPDTDIDIVTDILTDDVTDSDSDIVPHILTHIVTAVAPFADDVVDSDADSVTDAEAMPAADMEAEEHCHSVTEESLDDFLHVLPTDPFRGELKEFSESDCGVVGEGYAEYPSEEEEERKDEEENAEGRGLGQLSEAWSPQTGTEPSEWELMAGAVEGCEKQETSEKNGVGLEGGREEDGRKGHAESGFDVGLDIEEEMEVSDSSSVRSEGDMLNEGSEDESAGAHGKQALDGTEDRGSDGGQGSDESKKDDDVMYEMKWMGGQWDHGRGAALRMDGGKEHCHTGSITEDVSSADEDGILQSVMLDQTNEDKEKVLHVITREQASADEEDVGHAEYDGGRVEGSSAVSSAGAFGGWAPGAAPLSVSTSDRPSRHSESESSSSDSDTWSYQAAAPAVLRGLSAGPHHLWPGSDSQAGGATEPLSSAYAHRVRGAEEEEFENDDNVEEEDEEEEEERNWEQERERIQAFYRYYGDEEEDYGAQQEDQGPSSRKHTVRFCLPTLPLQRDSDSDMDTVSSSSEDSDSGGPGSVANAVRIAAASAVRIAVADATSSQATGAGTWMPVRTEDGDCESHREKLSVFLQQTQVTQVELNKMSAELRAQHQRSRVPSVMKTVLKMSLLSVLGVIMFWWATDQLEWIGPDWNT
ncbi:serine-aspartate repeat-containing protein I isoform X2 [Conger conger]|uniref:serine-aspartate repeat-containing protein I isoform X2 n=1 Tax=Conger conger TaxID=82655 RepID=UPI002A59C6F1|nr:serine-aspartate repeat-containing protein I isoform X2 [Conger conger]